MTESVNSKTDRTTGEHPVVFCYYLSAKIMERLPDYDRIFT